MSIIYSYPTSSPTVDDLVIGTSVGDDNATKSFVLGDIVTLINAESGSGTLTGVTIFTDSFLTASGNPTGPAVAYTIGLNATGTPSTNTFLGYSVLGQLEWRTPTVSAGIGVYKENIQKTLDVSSFNFTGAGVTNVSSSTDGAVTVTIPGAISAIETINAGTGVTVSPTTGNVVITNTGVIGVVDGTGITTSNSNGIITINAETQSGTGLARVDAGAGLTISAGTATSDPTLALSYVGASNFINAGIDAAAAVSDDSILFQQTSSSSVKSTTFGEIQASTLELVSTSISTANANVIENETATPPSQSFISVAPVQRVVTLLDSEYLDLQQTGTTLGNTLYLTTSTAVPQVEKTLTSITATVNYAQGTAWQYNGSYDIVTATRTGAQGGSYAFDTRIQAINGYTFSSGPSYTNASGTLDTTGNVSSSLTATMAPPPVAGTCTFQINYDTNNLTLPSGISASAYSITATGGSVVNGNQLQGTCPYSVASTEAGFAVQLVINDTAQYEFSVAPSFSYSPASGTSTAATSPVLVTCTINATIARKDITLTYTTTDTNSGGGVITSDYQINNITNSGSPTFTTNSSPNVGTSTIVAPYGSGYSISSSVNNLSGSTTTSGSGSVSNPITGTMTANATVTNNFTTTTGANSNTVIPNTAAVSDSSSPAGSYSTSYQYKATTESTWQTATGGSSTTTYDIGTDVEFRLAAFTVGSYYFSTIPTVSYNGVVTSNSAVFTTITVDSTSGGTTMPHTPTIAFETQAIRGQGVYNSTSHVSSNEACLDSNPTETVYLSVGGSTIYAGVTCYTSATGSGVVADGYYKANNNNSWMRITGGYGVVQSTGSC